MGAWHRQPLTPSPGMEPPHERIKNWIYKGGPGRTNLQFLVSNALPVWPQGRRVKFARCRCGRSARTPRRSLPAPRMLSGCDTTTPCAHWLQKSPPRGRPAWKARNTWPRHISLNQSQSRAFEGALVLPQAVQHDRQAKKPWVEEEHKSTHRGPLPFHRHRSCSQASDQFTMNSLPMRLPPSHDLLPPSPILPASIAALSLHNLSLVVCLPAVCGGRQSLRATAACAAMCMARDCLASCMFFFIFHLVGSAEVTLAVVHV